MKARPYILKEINWKFVKENQYDVAILPWGATEAHNYHLPYGTDQYLADAISEASAEIAWNKGGKVVVLPSIAYGVNTGQMDVSLCMNMYPSVQSLILRDISEVLNNHGVSKLVILNAHGGNNFKQIMRELSTEFPEIFYCSVDWWKAASPDGIFDEPGDHAGELETSVIMHLHPDLVLPLSEAGDGAAKEFKFGAFKKGYVQAQREWTQVTKDTGVGNPAKSTAEKGKKFFEASVNEIGNFIYELSQNENDELYK